MTQVVNSTYDTVILKNCGTIVKNFAMHRFAYFVNLFASLYIVASLEEVVRHFRYVIDQNFFEQKSHKKKTSTAALRWPLSISLA